ncbi:MAG: LPP20 family lipoprotein [Elusimicrobia bacterium]|nr:LPP20 family lipoprotein [Elusimicrobiota bacterium]
MKNWKVLAGISAVVFLFACATIGGPDWVKKGSGAFPGDPTSKLYGVGVAGPDPNTAVQLEQARSRARAELAAQMRTVVQRLVKDFMESHKDWFNLEDTAGSDEFFSYVGKQIVDETLVGSKQLDSWKDSKSGDLYMLYGIDLGSSFYDTYKKSLKRRIRERHRAVVKEKADEAIKELDKAVEKQQLREKEILGY